MAWSQTFIPSDLGDLSGDVRRVFQEIERETGRPGQAGQCTPPIDVLETDEVVELVMDLPGVSLDTVRVVLKGGVILVAGEKGPEARGRSHEAGDFHLVERGFGRFARAIRIVAAFDGARATATLTDGELRVLLPKIHDRRGRAQRVAITSPDSPDGTRPQGRT
jgi:HSP20 family protein